jgi:hypothetical protein
MVASDDYIALDHFHLVIPPLLNAAVQLTFLQHIVIVNDLYPCIITPISRADFYIKMRLFFLSCMNLLSLMLSNNYWKNRSL